MLAAALALACSSAVAPPPGGAPAPSGGAGPDPAVRTSSGPLYDPVPLYQKLGLLARGGQMPFVGNVAFYASPYPDSTHVVVAISIANASLTFVRENDRFRAGYSVSLTLREGANTVRQSEAKENVVVTSFKETTRGDESVLYEEILTLKPGRYAFSLTVRDGGSSRGSDENVTLSVPALGPGGLSTPVSFARAALRPSLEHLPQVVINPAAGATFGRDTLIPVYLESYGASDDAQRTLRYRVRTDDGRRMLSDSISVARGAGLFAGVLNIPVARIGIGAMMLDVWQAGGPDTVHAPIMVGFGGDLPVATFEEMLNYLRWFAAPYRIQSLRDTAPEARPGAWAAFIKQNAALTGESFALSEYFTRLLEANVRFREEGTPGWMTDRGRVLLGLGRPDQVYEQPNRDLSQRGRQQIWEYRTMNVALTFYDQTGFGRWRLTSTSETEFLTNWRRRVG